MKYRIMYKCCLFVFKILHGMIPQYLEDLVHIRIPSEMNLRSNTDDWKVEQCIRSRTLQYKVTEVWNELSYNIRCITSLNDIKIKLKTYYFSYAYT